MNSGNPTMFQSTHSLRSATFSARYFFHSVLVSIHALLAECDPDLAPAGQKRRGFNPRTPCGVRLETVKSNNTVLAVSIHALLAECDSNPPPPIIAGLCFNPRTPCGVRPTISRWTEQLLDVSIHALLAECDSARRKPAPGPCCFNPRTPCGVRPCTGTRLPAASSFNPRTPCGVRPGRCAIKRSITGFQSTHSLRSATRFRLPLPPKGRRFNPRTPCGVRQNVAGGWNL